MMDMLGGVADKIIGVFEAIITWIFDSLLEPFLGLYQLKDLIFGKTSEGGLVWGTFQSTDLENALVPTFYTTSTIAGFAFVTFIAIYGMRLADATRNPLKRNELISFVYDLAFVVLVLFNLPLVYDLLFTVNQGIVNVFNGAYESNLDSLKLGEGIGEEEEDGGGISDIIGQIVIQLVLLGLSVWANFYYFMRKVTLILLMALGPLMMVFYLNQRFRGMTGAWSKELIGSIFVQSIHAFVFWVIAVLSASSDGLIESVIVYAVFIPVSEGLRGLLGMGGGMQSNLSKAGAMIGIQGLAGMYGAVKGAFGDKSVMGALKGAYSGGSGKGTGGATGSDSKDTSSDTSSLLQNQGAMAGSDIGTTSKAEKMLKAGDVFSRAGKATMGMAGSLAGMALGPVGAIAGATMGSAVGSAVGGVLGRGGAAGLQGLGKIPDQFKKGIEAGKEKVNARNADLDENLANTMADRDTASWADGNKDSIMSDLQEKFPDASPKELESKFNEAKAEKRAELYGASKSKIASLKANAPNMASGQQMIAASSEAMADQWGKDNQQAFFADFDKNNTRKRGESDVDYMARRMTAFNEKKGEMKNAFAQAGQQFVSQNAVDGNEPISKADFQNHMSSAVSGMKGVGNSEQLIEAGNQAVSHVTGASLRDGKGKPNAPFIVGGIAKAKTEEMKVDFLENQKAAGISEGTALQNWMKNETSIHEGNVQTAQVTLDQASKGIAFRANNDSIKSKLSDGVVGLGAVIGTGTGLTNIAEVTKSAAQGTLVGYKSNANASFGGQVISAVQGGFTSAVNQSAELQGGVVEAQKNFQNTVGYVGGVLMGAKGYQVGSVSAAKYASPYKAQVQEAIQTPSEVIQMARTVTDQHGNQQIAPGAIRQVVTPNESYIEVQTKSGTTEIVSRKGSGHSNLKKGEVVYQDLSVANDTLVPVQPKGGQTSTYRLDSGGARIPSTVSIAQDPSSLLSSSILGSKKAAPVPQQQLPIYNQKVDSGSFKVEDIKVNGLANPQVVVEKGRQYVTAQKDGVTYRVSPVYAGDSRLGSTETIHVPVKASGSRLQAARPVNPNSEVAIQTSSNKSYYSTKSVEGLMVNIEDMMDSKHMDHANRTSEQRQYLDKVRRKQGLLG